MSIRRILIGILAFSFPFLFQFFLSLFFGRIFCGWVCPGGAFQEVFCTHMNSNKPNPKVDKVKFVSWIIWLVALVILVILVGGIKGANFFYNTYYIRGVEIWGYYFIIYSIVSLVIFVSASLIGKRGFCHCFCWMAPFMILGSKIGRKLRIPQLGLKSDATRCTDCKQCDKSCAMGLDVADMVKSGAIKSSECILCGKCVKACPKKVITFCADWSSIAVLAIVQTLETSKSK